MPSLTRIPFTYLSSINCVVTPIEDVDAGEKPISQEKQRLLDEMEPLVKQVLDCGDESAIEKLVELNGKMIETNVKEKLFPVEHCVPVRHLVGTNRKRTCLMETVQNFLGSVEDLKQAEAARRELQTLQSRLQAYMTELMLPPSWTFNIPDIDIHRPAGRQQLNNANGHNIRFSDFPNTQSLNAMDTTYDWTAGQTTRGEKILGFRPTKMTGTLINTGEMGQIYSSIRFVIEMEGKSNPIAIVDEARVGSQAVQAYLRLSPELKCNVAGVQKSYDRLDGFKFGNIKGVARDPNAAVGSRLPWTMVWIEYDGELRLINRTALRNAIKEKEADSLINKFLIEVGEEPDGPKEVRRLEQARQRGLREQLGNRSTRSGTGSQQMLGDQEEIYHGLASNNPSNFSQSTSARRQGPTPVRTSTTNTPSNMTREVQGQTGEQAVTRVEFDELKAMMQQLIELNITQRSN